MTHDKQGREYAKLSVLKAGDTIYLDAGFSCTSDISTTVMSDEHGLYFSCKDGHHYLSGQAYDGEHCVGVYHIDN